MRQYIQVLRQIMQEGFDHGDRTGTGRRSIYGVQARFNLAEGFPLVTTRKIFVRGMIEELLWFIRGSTDNKELTDKNVNIWNKWAVTEDDITAFVNKHCGDNEELKKAVTEHFTDSRLNSIGPLYGYNWRNSPQSHVHMLWPDISIEDLPSDKLKQYREEYDSLVNAKRENDELASFEEFCKHMYYSSVDQLNELIVNLKKRPFSARHIVTAWIPSLVPFETMSPVENVLVDKGALAACHAMFQCFVSPPKNPDGKKRLSLLMYQRSVDTPVGAPYNIAQYSLLLAMIAHVVDMEPHEFIWTCGDTHIYLNQLDQVKDQLTRQPLPLPKLWLNPEVKSLFDFKAEDIEIQGYEHHPDIKYSVSI